MPITLREKIDSRESQSGDSPYVVLLYDLEGTADDIAAKAEVLSSTPTQYDGLVRQSVGLEPQFVDTVAGTGRWLVTVRYGQYTPPTAGESSFSFDTSGGTQHITQSLSTIGKYPAGTAPDFKGAIGVTQDSVEGVDITIPVFSFAITRYIPAASMTPTYIGSLYALTGRTNNASWSLDVDGAQLTFAAGEALFLGASGSKRPSDDWEINFRFSASPNAANLTIGDITGVNKKGWEYLWVRYADSEDSNAKMLIKKPVAVYVEKVYEAGDFSLLAV